MKKKKVIPLFVSPTQSTSIKENEISSSTTSISVFSQTFDRIFNVFKKKIMLFQSVIVVTMILCIQSTIGLVKQPEGCLCYSNGGNTPRTPCVGPGCSAKADQDCAGDISLFLYYPNPKDADEMKPSTVNRRFGACGCPAGSFNRYANSKASYNAYYDDVGIPNRYFNISTCEDFGNIPSGNFLTYPGAAASRDNAISCCRACCEPLNGD